MLINILMGRTALYRVDEFYELQDIAVLFGTDASADDFNDSALGRTLDKILDAGAMKVFGAAALRAALREDVKFDVVHSDTTSWSVKGLYDSSSPDDQAFYIARGYSRDHRPDSSRRATAWWLTEKAYRCWVMLRTATSRIRFGTGGQG